MAEQLHYQRILMISANDVFFKGRQKVVGDEFWKRWCSGLGVPCSSREACFQFLLAPGGPLGAAKAKARTMANDDGYARRFTMVLLFVASGVRGVPGGVTTIRFGAKQCPRTHPESA